MGICECIKDPKFTRFGGLFKVYERYYYTHNTENEECIGVFTDLDMENDVTIPVILFYKLFKEVS